MVKRDVLHQQNGVSYKPQNEHEKDDEGAGRRKKKKKLFATLIKTRNGCPLQYGSMASGENGSRRNEG